MIDVHDHGVRRRAALQLENFPHGLWVVRIRAKAVHSFGRERDEVARSKGFDRIQDLLL